ncbi:MAG: 3-keto-disaccharide hydrolase [Limisphaerales bacterium]|jgi:hypothetical protein
MKKHLMIVTGAAVLAASAILSWAQSNPFLGRWALTIPEAGAGWLEIKEASGGYLDGSILWVSGSVVPVDSVILNEGSQGSQSLTVVRINHVDRKDADGNILRTQRYPELLMGSMTDSADSFTLTRISPNQNGKGIKTTQIQAERMPPIPPAPNLKNLKFGEPVELFNGDNLDGWRLTNPNDVNGWFAKDGLLVCDPKQERGKPRKSYGNLRTDAEFEDFNLTLKAKIEKGGNSGIYLRGVCEVQVADTYGRPLNSHNMGGLYSRITPAVAAERPAGEWQEFDITLCNQHVTVILNGEKVIDNKPVEGCTGGALWADISRPGPLYLQGDHTGVMYKDIKLRPILKD